MEPYKHNKKSVRVVLVLCLLPLFYFCAEVLKNILTDNVFYFQSACIFDLSIISVLIPPVFLLSQIHTHCQSNPVRATQLETLLKAYILMGSLLGFAIYYYIKTH